MLVDPDGREFKIVGSNRKNAFKQLSYAMAREGVKLNMAKGTGVLSFSLTDNHTGKTSKGVSSFINAMVDARVNVTMTADSDLETENGARHNGGAFLKAKYYQFPSGQELTDVYQEVNPDFWQGLEATSGDASGTNMLHEATEASIIGFETLKQNTDAVANGIIYNNADKQASPQTQPIFNNAYDKNGMQLLDFTSPKAVEYRYYTNDAYNNLNKVPFYIEIL